MEAFHTEGCLLGAQKCLTLLLLLAAQVMRQLMQQRAAI